MALILNLETATKCCSVSLAKDGQVIATKESWSDQYSHAEQLNLFIEDVIHQAGIKLSDLDAIAVSAGPGSYTGLRIGTSTAKGICYALNIPLISINSLKALASMVNKFDGSIVPMFDARRMEVYAAVYNADLVELSPTDAVIIDELSYQSELAKYKVLFIGPGAEKCQEMIQHENAVFDLNVKVSAVGMVRLSEQKYQAQQFEDVAYFEPAYLKDFVAGPPKKLL